MVKFIHLYQINGITWDNPSAYINFGSLGVGSSYHPGLLDDITPVSPPGHSGTHFQVYGDWSFVNSDSLN